MIETTDYPGKGKIPVIAYRYECDRDGARTLVVDQVTPRAELEANPEISDIEPLVSLRVVKNIDRLEELA